MDLIKTKKKFDLEVDFKAHYSPLCQYANHFIFDKDTCEDLVQEVFLKIWDKKPEINTSVSSYLYRAVKNACFNHLKKTAQQVIIPIEEVEDPIETPFELNKDQKITQVKEKVENAIAQLPPRCREIFIMRRNMQMSYDEISESLNISKKTIENHMNLAIKKLRTQLSKTDLFVYFLFIGSKQK